MISLPEGLTNLPDADDPKRLMLELGVLGRPGSHRGEFAFTDPPVVREDVVPASQ